MFRKGFSTVACTDAGYATIIETCKNYGLDGFEIRLNPDGSVLDCITQKDLKALKDAVKTAGLTISNLGSSACFLGYETEKLQMGKRDIDTAYFLNVKAIRIFFGKF